MLPEDPEVKNSSNVASVILLTESDFLVDRLMSRTSDWMKLKCVRACILVASDNLRT